MRGAYYDRYRPSEQPRLTRSRDEFVKGVEAELRDVRPIDPEQAIQSVFGVLNRHVPHGQIEKVRATLPEDLRELWPGDGEQHGTAKAGRKAARAH